jgi:hypothetical protein
MSLLSQINRSYMSRKYFLILFILVVYYCQCTNSKSVANSYDIFRYNYFDSSRFKLNDVDTNRFDREILENAFKVVSHDGDFKFLLVETISENIPVRNCTLLDMKTIKYYKLLTDNNKFDFKETFDSVNINRLNHVAENLNVLQQRAEAHLPSGIHKHDLVYYIVSIIEAKGKNVFIKSYHLNEWF